MRVIQIATDFRKRCNDDDVDCPMRFRPLGTTVEWVQPESGLAAQEQHRSGRTSFKAADDDDDGIKIHGIV